MGVDCLINKINGRKHRGTVAPFAIKFTFVTAIEFCYHGGEQKALSSKASMWFENAKRVRLCVNEYKRSCKTETRYAFT